MFPLGRSPRLRPSPYFDKTVEAGVSSFTVYNHMLLPSAYEGGLAEYEALINAVTIWDVAGERQVEVKGPDAARLMQYLCTRDISKVEVGQARYTFICNPDGGILNDPVILRLADDHFWMSLADRDILLWAQAIAFLGGYDVQVVEPDVSPLQVQGPKSIDVIRTLFGDDAADMRYYRFVETDLDGVPVVVSRTGWSGEFGYEVFLRDGSKGGWLWDRLFEAGAPHGVKPAAPNQIRRIEGGILSYGSDMDDRVNPLELGFDRLVAFDSDDDFIGKAALTRVKEVGASRRMMGIRIAEPLSGNTTLLPVTVGGELVGRIGSMTWSPRFGQTLALALLDIAVAELGTEVVVEAPEGPHTGTVSEVPFVDRIT